MDIRFNHLGYLHLLWVVLALAGVAVYGVARKRRAMACFASTKLHPVLLASYSPRRQQVRTGLVLMAMVALVLGMIDPRWGVYYQDITRRGIDIMFVLDVSRSMSAEDIAPNRLGRAKQYISDMVDVLGGDRVGLVTFAGEPVLKCPLTINYGAFKMMLDEVDTRSSPRGGSLIGDAVRLAAGSFTDKIKQYKAIVLFTDGEDQESFPIEAAEKAFTENGIRVYTVGLGGAGEGARIPVDQDGHRLYLQHDGQEVWSKMNSGVLEQMATRGGGMCIPAGTRNVDMGQIFQEKMATADAREYETQSVRQYHVQFQWFAGLALLLLLIECCMTDRRPRSAAHEIGGRAA